MCKLLQKAKDSGREICERTNIQLNIGLEISDQWPSEWGTEPMPLPPKYSTL